jgi:hypothetical protein
MNSTRGKIRTIELKIKTRLLIYLQNRGYLRDIKKSFGAPYFAISMLFACLMEVVL